MSTEWFNHGFNWMLGEKNAFVLPMHRIFFLAFPRRSGCFSVALPGHMKQWVNKDLPLLMVSKVSGLGHWLSALRPVVRYSIVQESVWQWRLISWQTGSREKETLRSPSRIRPQWPYFSWPKCLKVWVSPKVTSSLRTKSSNEPFVVVVGGFEFR